jgi:hypothetical protein
MSEQWPIIDDLCKTGVAHEVEEDNYWNGHFVPKGTRILPLDW